MAPIADAQPTLSATSNQSFPASFVMVAALFRSWNVSEMLAASTFLRIPIARHQYPRLFSQKSNKARSSPAVKEISAHRNSSGGILLLDNKAATPAIPAMFTVARCFTVSTAHSVCNCHCHRSWSAIALVTLLRDSSNGVVD